MGPKYHNELNQKVVGKWMNYGEKINDVVWPMDRCCNSYLIHVELEELHEKVISKASLKDVLIYNAISFY
jgi:hypothetical protein